MDFCMPLYPFQGDTVAWAADSDQCHRVDGPGAARLLLWTEADGTFVYVVDELTHVGHTVVHAVYSGTYQQYDEWDQPTGEVGTLTIISADYARLANPGHPMYCGGTKFVIAVDPA